MQLHGLDLNLVVALRALLTERNVTRAAKTVGLGQSSMSHALSRLRAHFGDPLLVQVGREMVLTERARALQEPVSRAVAELARVFLEPQVFDPRTSERTFHIAAPDNLEFYLLPNFVRLMVEQAPRIALRFQTISEHWHTQLLHGDIDLKLGRRSAMPSGLRSQELFEEEFACVVRRHHSLASKRITVSEYADLMHLVIRPVAGQAELVGSHVDAVLARHGKQRRIVLTVPHFVLAPFIVESTDLALTAAKRLLDPFVRSLKLRRVELPFKLPRYRLTQVWAQRSEDDPAHAWLRATILRAAGMGS